MTSPSPAQAKSFLTNIRESVIDNENNASLELLFHTFLQLEIFQRGVVVMLNNNNSNNNTKLSSSGSSKLQQQQQPQPQQQQQPSNHEKILEAVQSVAGKAILTTESVSLPKPLMASSCVMQGKITEAMLNRIQHDNNQDKTAVVALRQSSLSKQTLASILRRCQEVEDDRFGVLFKLWDEEHASDLIIHLLALAEGSYYRAASFQPDAPPMHKKAWETHSERRRHQQPPEQRDPQHHWESWGAIPALTSLVRIMKGKGNAKRAAELSLRLASAWLDATQMILESQQGGGSFSSLSSSSLTTKIVQAFVEPHHRSMEEGSWKEPHICLVRAQEWLAEVTTSEQLLSSLLSPRDACFSGILSLHCMHMQITVGLVTTRQDVQQQAKNRSRSLTASQVDEKAKEAFFLTKWGSNDNDKNGSHLSSEYEMASKVWQQIINGTLLGEDDDSSSNAEVKSSAFAALTQFVMDQREWVLAIQKSKQHAVSAIPLWMRLGQCAAQVLRSYQPQSSAPSQVQPQEQVQAQWDAALASERTLVQETLSLICQVSWMTLDSRVTVNPSPPFTPADYRTAHRIATALCEEKRKQAAQAQTAAVSSKSKSEEQDYLHLRVLQFASQCWILLHGESFPSATILDVTNDMLSLLNVSEGLVEWDANYGGLYLGSLLCWSGFFRTPWEYCILPEARLMIQKAQSMLQQAESTYHRQPWAMERTLLDLAEADAESSGLTSRARGLYQKILDASDSSMASNDSAVDWVLIRTRCYLGLARLNSSAAVVADESGNHESAAQNAEESLNLMYTLQASDAPLLLWKSGTAQALAINAQIALARRLIADQLIRASRFQEAGDFLKETVQHSPSDPLALFSLGAFLMRMVFFYGQDSPEAHKVAQTQLLKAAKLDSTKAGPFALLGYWYEHKQDIKRAVGCYAKALVLDSAHPVAGRGMIRLADETTLVKVLQKAITSTSSLNGWAWLSIGVSKAKFDGEDELAVSALLKATRARDVEAPSSDPLSIFYNGPSHPSSFMFQDLTTGFLELSGCYRRLGRCSAELRTLQTALDVAGENASWSVLHACAQAELEMGLIEDARAKFARAAAVVSGSRSRASMFGQGLAAFMMGRRDLQDGKAGIALDHIMGSITSCEKFARESCSWSKLLGDMLSYLAAFPTDVFAGHTTESDVLNIHLQLVARGESYYSAALEKIQDSPHDESKVLQASLLCDAAVNLLLQAHVTAHRKALSGHECAKNPDTLALFHKARDRFIESLQTNPLQSSAWCGLGCALVDDPLKAQHAFSRAIELDAASSDSYANLGFLLAENQAYERSAEVCDLLTQVADTPMTWINRAVYLENQALLYGRADDARMIEHISDAYRAALQVQKDPFALLGLAASFRVALGMMSSEKAAWENKTLRREYYSVTSINPPDVLIVPEREEVTQVKLIEAASSLAAKQSIIESPQRGDAWLAIATDIVLKLSEKMDEKDLHAARAAASRATMLLMDKMTVETGQAGEQLGVQASDVSNALALENWLEGLSGNVASNKKAQLALMICPQNGLARQLLLDGNE